MADNIAKRTDRLEIEIQSGGQLSLMPQTAENQMVSDDFLMEKIKDLLEVNCEFIRLNRFLAAFYNEYGVLSDLSRISSGQVGSILKTLEKNAYIDVKREPEMTDKGKLSRFWQEGKGKKLCLRKRNM